MKEKFNDDINKNEEEELSKSSPSNKTPKEEIEELEEEIEKSSDK